MVLIVVEDEIPVHVDRSNREDHKKTDHDSYFSEWKLLICPHGWKNGKGGAVTRYRLENLPQSFGPGTYELAVCKLPSRDRHGKLEPGLVVYVGEAENIRVRLQQYGRDGTHLCRKNGFREKKCRLFDPIFARGCCIIYRWASMKSKAAAQRTEARLLEKYDYAWNIGSNGARRPNDILRKLDKHVSNKRHLPIKIKSNKQVNGRCRRHLDHRGGGGDITYICGAATSDGAPCERPVSGNGRCWQHSNYGRSSSSNKRHVPVKIKSNKQVNGRCRRHLNYGGDGGSSFTSRNLNYGCYDSSFTPRWLDHGGDDIILICGATTDNGAPCERPVSGNGRCWQHLDYSSSSSSSGGSSSSSGCFTCGTFNYDPQWFF
uniref:GIY-YIG domain-containing protein n=1 Tax=Gossypium raimondii TaxID=29730 RepID=A0A0D2VLY3_GOSRA|nr:unnamed protein product [Gossypium raimondii]KJB84409.1 hypothetical protein B456_N024000 [Gossypium raimondii]